MKHKKFLIIILLAAIILCIVLMSNNTGDKNVTSTNKSPDEDISFNGHTYDKKEYPKDSYKLDELYTSRIPSYAVKQYFEDSDFDHNGLLEKREISAMDYKLKHSQYTYNGPYGYN